MRRNLGAIVVAAAVLAFAPGLAGNAARAHETTDGLVFAAHCIFADSGAATVAAGSEVVIGTGWLTQIRGDQSSFLGAQTTVVSVNDGPMWDVSDQWGQPTVGTNSNWVSLLEVPTGVTLESGEQLRFTMTQVLDRDVRADGGYGIAPNAYRAGLLFGGTCTVTAE